MPPCLASVMKKINIMQKCCPPKYSLEAAIFLVLDLLLPKTKKLESLNLTLLMERMCNMLLCCNKHLIEAGLT